MRVHIATDHAGLELSDFLINSLTKLGYDMVDHGPKVYDALDDYPAFCIRAAEAVIKDQSQHLDSVGIVIGGSGNGEQIAANKVLGIRAALAWNENTARLAKEHNDANVIAIGARQHEQSRALDIIKVFLEAKYSGEERHSRRIKQVSEYEISREIIS